MAADGFAVEITRQIQDFRSRSSLQAVPAWSDRDMAYFRKKGARLTCLGKPARRRPAFRGSRGGIIDVG
ncbi:hypothetical protein G5V57_06905 [Nordella sp. HKS 07]|uniref:hypothetical protein n=1 Tax=Nordella sp. HKS 07 TaxID=2712222 RepID=UPI0013E1F6F3|nr:hypothetical protein [Nordella sp. HKS 07]QIG47479.1 hypothetical protein G5V57_06905 [Nordella sp. HKS 07]